MTVPIPRPPAFGPRPPSREIRRHGDPRHCHSGENRPNACVTPNSHDASKHIRLRMRDRYTERRETT